MPEGETRVERDALGEIAVPADALWGAATQRAIHNFPISGEPMPRAFLSALGQIKRAAAHANRELGVVDAERAAWIARAAGEKRGGQRGQNERAKHRVHQSGSLRKTKQVGSDAALYQPQPLLASDPTVAATATKHARILRSGPLVRISPAVHRWR